MAAPEVRLLLAEDNPDDAEIELREIRRAGIRVTHKIVDSTQSYLSALKTFRPDIILSDFSMPGFDGMEALMLAREYAPDTPFIFVSGTLGEEYAIRALKNGATDYVIKTNIMRLPAAVERALAEAQMSRERRRIATELEIARERLQEREAALNRAQHIAKLAHVISGPGGTFESWSDTLPRLIDVNPLRMPQTSRDWLSMVHPEDQGLFQAKTSEANGTGKRVDLEYRFRRADGAWLDIRQVIEPIRGSGRPGDPVRWFSTFLDVTDQKRAEARISRLNRVHAVLSGINAAIVHTRDRQELFREVCRIAIDSGRFRMVWFGLLDKEGERVVPVASAGEVRGFFDAASTAVTHARRDGHGLTGRAIREMKPMVSNDIQNDPQRTMKAEFRERGINSLAVLPLIIGNEAVGVVNLYATDAGFFDEEEMRLLRELAGDISFALDNIDKQEKLRRLTRVNEMLSSINGAIVRIRNPLELYQEACRIAVEIGSMRFAWLCVVDEDEMRLKPVASAGADDGYLDLIRGRLSLRDDPPEGHGIAAKAVRENRAVVVNDAQSDPNVLFKEYHAARGIRSTAVLPLCVAGKVVGSFGLHSGEVGFFDDQEMKLIDEIASNISFALDHMEKEDKVARLNRVYAVLSGINGLIVRVRDREELYREACAIAVDAGRFKLAWIGIIDREAMEVKPVAVAGDAQGYVGLMPLKLDDDPPKGLAGHAIKERKPMIANDIENDARLLLRAKAVKRGFRSLVILPLIVSDEPIGVLALYADSAGFFDEAEMKLLVELAGDISFASNHIDKSEKLDYLAYYDTLTGLANRTLFRERLQQYLGSSAEGQTKLGVVVADLERFRAVNDSLGRQAGDLVLTELSERLKKNVGDANRLARLGADHFAVVLPAVKNELDAGRMLIDLSRACLKAPFRIDGNELLIASKAGIALFPEHGADADTLLGNAEAALQRAKDAGEPYLFFEQRMTERVAENLSLETALRHALERNEFVLHYQPRIELKTRRIAGVEALIRWQSPQGLVLPAKFIGLLEETGLIGPVGAWALEQAVQQHQSWLRDGLRAPGIAVNISVVQLRQKDFVERVQRVIELGAKPPGVDLEITESMIMGDVEENIEKLRAVRDLGLHVAIDDFGTGYSSLAYLAKLPVTSLKIDRSFVNTMLEDPNSMTLVSTIISLAHSLKLKVVAEGVESEEQAKVLVLLGCEEAQGYLYGKPVTADEFAGLLKTRSGA